jgi:hypothetical protein
MRRFAAVLSVVVGLGLVVGLLLNHPGLERAVAFPTRASVPTGSLAVRCLISQPAVDDQEFPPYWRSERTLILDTLGVRGEAEGWYPVRKTDPNMPQPPAMWRFANSDSIDVQFLDWPVGFRTRLALRDSVQSGRLVMTDDAGGKWVPRGSWKFSFTKCGAP